MKPNIITSYKFVCGIDPSVMIAVQLFGWKADGVLLEKGSFQHHSQDGVE
jgi:hypothetical protein